MKLIPRSLLARTFVVMLMALVLSQTAALWLFDRYITQPRIAQSTRNFVSHLKTVSAAMLTLDAKGQREFLERVAEQEGIRIHAGNVTPNMHPITDRPGLALFRERIRESFGPEAEVYVRDGEAMDAEGRSRMLYVHLPAGDQRFWVAFPRARVERDPVTAFVAWSFVGLTIATLATLLILWRLNRPLQELARAADQLGKGGNPEPVAETGPNEIRGLARAFNQMKTDLHKAERDRATFLAGVSHDLRTPLARMRLDVEMLEGKIDPDTQGAMVQDLADMGAIIDQFIDFTRSEAAEALSLVNLSELARSCTERFARSGGNVRCELADVPGLMLRPLSMRRLVDNLLANAERHAGGEIVIRTAQSGNAVVLSVLDRGPGIPVEHIERLKQPFTRRDESRGGSSGAGLGLAIVDRIAAIHGARFDLLPRDGGGLEARLTLETNRA